MPQLGGRTGLPQTLFFWSYEPVQTDYDTLKVVPPTGQENLGKFFNKVSKSALKDYRDVMKALEGFGLYKAKQLRDL